MDAFLEIIRPDGTCERVRIEGEKMTVGRSHQAGIPIPDARAMEAEHLLVAPRMEGCWVSVSDSSSGGVSVRGKEFDHGILAWGSELVVGNITLRVIDALPKETQEKAVGAPVMVAFFIIVPLAGWLLLSEPAENLNTDPGVAPPALIEGEASCPSTGGPARHRADLDAEAATAKSERYPFAPQDGLAAVRLFRRAEACYRACGAETEASQMQREGGWMQERIEEDYRTHRLRLERALTQRRFPDALIETRALIELLRHLEGPYLEWLRLLDRQLQLHLEQTTP